MHQVRHQFNKYFALFLIAVLGIIIYFSLKEYLGMFFSTVIIFTLFRPMQKWLVRDKKIHRSIASTLTLLTSLFALVIPLVTTVLVIGNGVGSLVQQQQKTIQGFVVELPQLLDQNKGILDFKLFNDFTIGKALENVNINYGSILNGVTTFAQNTVSGLTTGISNFFLQMVIMYFILYFLFRDWDKYSDAIYEYSPFNKQNTTRLIQEFDNMTVSNIVGSGAVAVSQGVAMWLGLTLFGYSGTPALFWGFITVLTGFIPLLGAPMVWIPAVIILFVQQDWFNAIGLLIWSLTIISWIDNFIRPYIASKVGNIHPLVSIIGIFIGIQAFGILGVILGPALLSFFLLTVRMFHEEFLDKNTTEDN